MDGHERRRRVDRRAIAVFTAQPAALTVLAGQPASFSAAASSAQTPGYQWLKSGIPVPGATQATLTFASAQPADAATYACVVTNVAGRVISAPAVLTVLPSAWLANVSVRTALAEAQSLIVGFTVEGGPKNVLVRAAGPALLPFGVTTAMLDPKIELYRDSAKIVENDNWSSGLAGTFSRLGAFPFPAGSRDAGLQQNVTGSHSAIASGSGPGVVLVELYDAGEPTAGRLINLSARNRVGIGADLLIAGFHIAGTGPKRVLIRAVGPTLGGAPFNLPGVLSDPKLELYDAAGAKVIENDNWDSSFAPTFAGVGAFPLPTGSKDAALVVTLNAGNSYSVWVQGADGGTGEALVEIYELP